MTYATSCSGRPTPSAPSQTSGHTPTTWPSRSTPPWPPKAPNVVNQLTSRTSGGTIRVAGFLSETGTATIAGVPARMTSTTNFEGDAIIGVGSYSIPVTATDINNNSASSNVVRTFTANGLATTFTYDLVGNQLTKSNSTGVIVLSWAGNQDGGGSARNLVRPLLENGGSWFCD
jgi:hypothetical protein